MIIFKKLRFKVQINSLFQFIYWYFKYKTINFYYDLFKLFICYFSTKKELLPNEKWTWCTQEEDGQFRIFFNNNSKQILKISQKINNLKLNDLKNHHLYKFSPIINIYKKSDYCLIKEKFIAGKTVIFNEIKLNMVLNNFFALNKNFNLELLQPSVFVGKVSDPRLKKYINKYMDTNVTIIGGYVHGDLIPQNILQNLKKELIITDWEYAGYGIGIYDIWYLLFNFEGCKKIVSSKIKNKIRQLLNLKHIKISDDDLQVNIKLCESVWRGRR